MSDFLKAMAASSAARAAAASRAVTAKDLDKPVHSLRLSTFDLVAEIKNRSPAEGELATHAGSRVLRARTYAEAGAAAISVLTEPDQFDGELWHLEEVVAAITATSTPVMRKDFLVDVVQIIEAKVAGASGVLLIAAMLSDTELARMLDCAFEYNLFVLLEVFDENDLQRSVALLNRSKYREQAEKHKLLLGVNTRNLRTLKVAAQRLEQFARKLPDGVVCVAESGQHTAADAARVQQWGYAAALVGTALMRAKDPGKLVSDMLQAGREHAT